MRDREHRREPNSQHDPHALNGDDRQRTRARNAAGAVSLDH